MKDLIKVILETGSETELSDLGEKLFKVSQKNKKPLDEKDQKDIDWEQHVKYCKKLERDQDYLWIPYSTWNSFSFPAQNEIKEKFNPLFFQGIHLSFSQFFMYEDTIFQKFSPYYAYYFIKEPSGRNKLIGIPYEENKWTMTHGEMERQAQDLKFATMVYSLKRVQSEQCEYSFEYEDKVYKHKEVRSKYKLEKRKISYDSTTRRFVSVS